MDAADDATDEINGRSDQPPDDAAPAGPLPASRASLVLPTPALSADLRAPQDAPPALSSLLIRPPRPRSVDDDDDDEENRVVETDPTGRFSRYAKRLGKGAYKEVYKAYDEDEGVEVAWNQLRVDHLGSREAKRILSEIQILKSMRSENVITMYHAWCAKGADNIERVYFITELMTSSLKTYLKKTSKAVVGKILKKWCRQILQGLCYLHSRTPPIIHRDLKCENIFVNGHNGQLKIGDLGLAIPKNRDHASSVLGTPEFMAPELYDENYDEHVDIYAFGMVVLEMVTKEFPYSECSNQYQIYKKVSNGIKPFSLSKVKDEETVQFIELCTQFVPHKRPSAAELLMHPFLRIQEGPGGGGGYLTSSAADLGTDPDAVLGLADYPSSLDRSKNTAAGPRNTNTPLPTPTPLTNLNPPSGTISSSILANAPSVASLPAKPSSASSNSSIPQQPLPQVSAAPTVVIELIDRHSESTVTLKMVYTAQSRNTNEIKFPFNLPEDTATDVVSEMVREQLVDARDESIVRKKLEEKVKSILLGRVEESSRRVWEAPPSSAASTVIAPSASANGISADALQKGLNDSLGAVEVSPELRPESHGNHYATPLRTHSEVSASSAANSMTSSTEGRFDGAASQAMPSRLAYPTITPPSSSPLLPRITSQVIPKESIMAKGSSPVFSKAFVGDLNASDSDDGGSGKVAPSPAFSEGYKRGQSGSSATSSDYHPSPLHGTVSLDRQPRRPSHMSTTSSEHTTNSGTQLIVESAGGSLITPSIRSTSATNVPNLSGSAVGAGQPPNYQSSAAPAPNNASNVPNAMAQQRLLELQERSLKDLGSNRNGSSNNPPNGNNAGISGAANLSSNLAPHINHHAVHHLQHQFHPHHAASYSTAGRISSGGGGGALSGVVWSTTAPSAANGGSVMIGTSTTTTQQQQQQRGTISAVGTPPSASSPNFSALPTAVAVAPAPAGTAAAAKIPQSSWQQQQPLPLPAQASVAIGTHVRPSPNGSMLAGGGGIMQQTVAQHQQSILPLPPQQQALQPLRKGSG
ncbi:Serine/threonine-protein kinase wnk8 [Entophlyctis luteolus]|nr:Serine/threonine-protein kinase wnk8 [Entophlyctis luteolus]